MKTFMEDCLSGNTSCYDIDRYITNWHRSQSELPLHEFLGMKYEQYADWLADPLTLKRFLEKRIPQKFYSPGELRAIEDCFLPEHEKGAQMAFEALGWLLDLAPSVTFSSSPDPTLDHPAYKAIIAMGEVALLPLLKRFSYKDEENIGCGWELMAAQTILKNLGADSYPPKDMHGRVLELKKFYRIVIKKFMAPRVKEYRRVINGKCACGKKGKWISDGICRTGYYCRKCSDEALENA